jgi:hypothetical protein
VYRRAVQAAQQAAHRYHWDHEKETWKQLIRRLNGEKTVHVWSMDRLEPPPYGGTLEVAGQVENLVQSGYQVVLHATTKAALAHTQALTIERAPGRAVQDLPPQPDGPYFRGFGPTSWAVGALGCFVRPWPPQTGSTLCREPT